MKVPKRAVDDKMIQKKRATRRYRDEILAQAAAVEPRSKELKDSFIKYEREHVQLQQTLLRLVVDQQKCVK